MNLKKFKLGCLALSFFVAMFLITANSNTVQASDVGSTYALNHIQGNWYDNNGNLVISVKGIYLNDCQIVNIHDFVGGDPGSAYFTVHERQGNRDIYILWDSSNEGGNYHTPYIEVNNSGVNLYKG